MRQSETKVRRELQEIIEKLREFDEQDEQKAGRLAEFEVDMVDDSHGALDDY